MAKGFKRKGKKYAARLDPAERGVVSGLMEQVLDLLAPDGPDPSGEGDTFDEIVAGLGGMGMGVSVSFEDQVPEDQVREDRSPEDHLQDDALDLGDEVGAGGEHPPYRDPALERLLPPGNRDDDEAAEEFRRLTEHGLRSRKATNLRMSIEALDAVEGDKVELGQAQALAMVVALTDVRLVLGERLGLRTDDDAERLLELLDTLDPDDPAVYAMAVYDFLTWLQETLAQALLPT